MLNSTPSCRRFAPHPEFCTQYGRWRCASFATLDQSMADQKNTNAIAIHASDAPARSRPSVYPEPFSKQMRNREKHPRVIYLPEVISV